MTLNELILALQNIQKEVGDVIVLDYDYYECKPEICKVTEKEAKEWNMKEGETYVYINNNS